MLALTDSPQRLKPNILLILADDLGWGDVGCYGQKSILTPNLDRMAREGIQFLDFYSGSTVCAPSRCALMTGLHTGHCRIRGNADVPLRPEDHTIAELLSEHGYATGIFGKWGLGEAGSTGIPTKKGFDEWFGYLNQVHAHNYYPDFLWRNERKESIPPGTYAHDLFTREALRFIREKASRPFFLYLPYTIPHANSEKIDSGMQVPSDAPYSAKPWPQQLRNYAAMITRMDSDVGKIIALLAELGIDRDTAVFFSSDNGPAQEGGGEPEFFDSNGPFRGIKRDLYEGGVRIPLIARWTGRIKPGRVNRDPFALWDLFPTFAEIAGAPVPANLDGLSLVPALIGRRQTQHEYLYWEFHERGFEQAIHAGRWKGVRHGLRKQIELYDLYADPSEQRGLAARFPEVARRLEAQLDSARTPSAEFPIREPKESVVPPARN